MLKIETGVHALDSGTLGNNNDPLVFKNRHY